MNDLMLPPEPRPSRGAASAREPFEIVIEPQERRAARDRRRSATGFFILAAIVGGGAYAFHRAQDAMQNPSPAPAAAQTAQIANEATQRQIAALQTEVRDLRAKLDAVESRQPADAANARPAAPAPNMPTSAEKPAPATGEPSANAPAPQPETPRPATAETPVTKVPPTPSRIIAGYRLRDVFRGNALVESRRGVVDVQPGDVLPDAGRVTAIQKRGGRWVVSTESGDIVGEAPAPRRRPIVPQQYGYEPGPLAPRFFFPF